VQLFFTGLYTVLYRNATGDGGNSIPVHISIVLPHSFFKEKDYLKEINNGKKIFAKMKFQVHCTVRKDFKISLCMYNYERRALVIYNEN
jgi:hypothetical protein